MRWFKLLGHNSDESVGSSLIGPKCRRTACCNHGSLDIINVFITSFPNRTIYVYTYIYDLMFYIKRKRRRWHVEDAGKWLASTAGTKDAATAREALPILYNTKLNTTGRPTSVHSSAGFSFVCWFCFLCCFIIGMWHKLSLWYFLYFPSQLGK